MPKRKRSNDSESDHSLPTLVELCCHQVAKELWQRVIRQNTLPSGSSKFDQTFIEHCRDLVIGKLQEYSTSASIVAHRQSTIVAQVNRLMDEMVNEFSPVTLLSRLMTYVLETPKWNEFSFSMWCCLKEEILEQRVVSIFETIVMKVDKEGLEAIAEGELAMYLHIWKDLSKLVKRNVFDSLAYCYLRISNPKRWNSNTNEQSKENLKDLRRDLRFMSILLAEFDFSERRQIWQENWLYLVFGASASSLEALMKMCCERDESIEQFKQRWLAKNEIIENYYGLLIRWRLLDELNAFLSFYSADESKVLDLTARILRSYFSSSWFYQDLTAMVKIAQCGQWLERAIRMPEFEHYLRPDDLTIRMKWCWYFQNGMFDQGLDYITLFVPDTSERLMRERRFLRDIFLGNDLPMPKANAYSSIFVYHFVAQREEFDKHIGRIFDSVNEAADFKKQMIYSPFTMEELRNHLDGYRNILIVQQFVTMCLPDERDLSVWKESFMRDTLNYLRLSCHLSGLFGSKSNFITWCLDSPEKVAKFRTELPIDDLYVALERFVANDPRRCRRRGNIANDILRWWFGDDHQMAAFKVRKLKRCATRGPMFDFLLSGSRNQYADSQSDEERMTHALASCTNSFEYS